MAVQSDTLNIIWIGVTMKKKWWKQNAKEMVRLLERLHATAYDIEKENYANSTAGKEVRFALHRYHNRLNFVPSELDKEESKTE